MTYKYINLFSGIGGWELGLQDLPMENVLSCEIDKYARTTFEANFSHLPCIQNNQYPMDIRSLPMEQIPDFDILIGSPPCQSFSMSGQRKGLLDAKDDKGNMFFYVLNILKAHRPRAFVLENVRGLLTAEKGRSFRIIHDLFINAGYSFYYKVVRGSDCGIPQVRQRVFMVGFRNDLSISSPPFEFPHPVPLKFTMRDVFRCQTCNRDIGMTVLTHSSGKKFGQPHNSEWYLVDGVPRKITIEESQQIMGIPTDFIFPVPKSQKYKQLGNGIIPDCVNAVCTAVIKHLQNTES